MSTLKNIWQRYKSVIITNCTNEFVADTSLAYWQNRLFAASVIYIIPLSLVAIIPGIYVAYITDLKWLIASDIIAMLTILAVAFFPGFSVLTRKILFNSVLYITSLALLIYLGSFGPGLLYLLGISIFIVLSLDKKYGYIAVGLNTTICIVAGIFIYFEIGNIELLTQYGLDTWIAVSSNLIFLSAVSVILIPILFDGLQSAILEENKLRTELQYEDAKLKGTVEELHQKNKELEQFSYTISHDLKEPLRMIRNFMELLERRYGNQLDEKAHTYIHYATDGAQRMTQSIDDLLEYSRIGRLYSNIEKVNLDLMIEEIMEPINPQDNPDFVSIEYDDLPEIKAIPICMKMLLQNLISNGIKYQPAGQQPKIKITASDLGEFWEFAVTDNGIGIEDEYREEVFNLFRRLHTRDQYSGNGMGLAISKKIVEQHNGEIWVDSEPGKGSTFYFTLQKNTGLQ